ncbi:MAG: hypothetical protein IAE78_21715 [Myxococcus sp.]|nr:hypothetical protein [Myxococcus sp.]
MRLALLTLFTLTACDPGASSTDGGPTTDAGAVVDGGATPTRLTGTGNAVLAQHGKFLVAGGDLKGGGDSDFQVGRLFADGGVDTSFGANGKVTLSWPPYINPVVADAGFVIEQKTDTAYALLLQGDKIVVGGTVQSQGDMSGFFGLARFSADGVVDPTFGTEGRAQVVLGFGGPAHALAARSDGKLYAAGFVTRGMPGTNGTNFGIARFSADGAFDPSFGGAMGVQADFGKNEDARGIVFQGLKVLVGGGDDFIVARYQDDGALDATFGTAGVATSPGGFANSFKALPSGALLLSGSVRDGSLASWTIKLVRYTADGQLDAAFGTGGVVMAPFDNQQTSTFGLEVMSDGRIVIVTQAVGMFASVARFSAAGAVDTSFGGAGIRQLEVPLPLLAGMYPPSANQVTLVGNTLYAINTNTTGQVFVLFRSTAL